MNLYAGTSGFSYKEWKGGFYPEKQKDAGMLAFYGERLNTCEINNTFYRMPRRELLERWAAQVPEGFRFVLKASRRITHIARLDPGPAGDALGYLWSVSAGLGDKRGPLLFQLPPTLRADLGRLREFLGLLPAGCRAAFEFRHESWTEEPVITALSDAGCALCAAETDEVAAEIRATCDWGYLRLRREDYTADELKRWAERLRAQPWTEAYVFFKHEDTSAAPNLAAALTRIFHEGENAP
jgi:uncharacterized protein YecE (DUF72 family)